MASNMLEEAVRFAIGSPTTVELLASSAKIGALTGAAAGAGVVLVGGVAAARRKSDQDGFTLLGRSLSQIGHGAILGAIGALAASATGIGVAALVGRGLLTVAAPALVGTFAAAAAQGPVSRFTRDVSDKLADGLRARFYRDRDRVESSTRSAAPDSLVPPLRDPCVVTS
jgi:hypothetical protein